MGKIFGIALAAVVALIVAVTLGRSIPGITALYHLYFDQDRYYSLFYDGLGLGESVSKLLALIFVFSYAVAGVGFATFATVLLSNNLNAQAIAIGFFCFIGVFAIPPLAHVILDPVVKTVCFNQSTGTPLKWYIVRSGKIVLFDSPGFDPTDGAKKEPVTADVCRMHEQQAAKITARQISNEEALNRMPNVWYRVKDNTLLLYDALDFVPGTTQLTTKFPEASIPELKARVAKDREQARLEAEQKAKEEKALQQRTAVATLANAVRDSTTGLECLVLDTGLVPRGTPLAKRLLYSQINVFVQDMSWADSRRTRDAIAVQVQDKHSAAGCFVYAVSPSPPALSDDQAARVDQILSALTLLGSSVIQTRPVYKKLPDADIDQLAATKDLDAWASTPGPPLDITPPSSEIDTRVLMNPGPFNANERRR